MEGKTRQQEGQAMVEFIIIFWFAFSFLMLVIQIVLIFNAHSMVKLAAFNAARAAIVARGDDATEAIKFEDMRTRARNAAFLTILPVVPGFHARVGSLGDLPSLLTSLPSDLGSLGVAAVKGHGQGIVALGIEYIELAGLSFFKVKFQKLEGSGASETWKPLDNFNDFNSMPQNRIEFDDPSKSRQNLIRVIVEWDYPLVIPLADQILYAMVNREAYALALVQKNEFFAAARVAARIENRPVWEWGWALRDPSVFGPWNLTGFRIPIRGSYIMRMQWDRGAGS